MFDFVTVYLCRVTQISEIVSKAKTFPGLIKSTTNLCISIVNWLMTEQIVWINMIHYYNLLTRTFNQIPSLDTVHLYIWIWLGVKLENLPLTQTWWWRCSESSALALLRRRTETSDWPSHCWPRSPPPAVCQHKTDLVSLKSINRQPHPVSTLALVCVILSVNLFVLLGGKEHVHLNSPEWLKRESEAMQHKQPEPDHVSKASPAGCSACSCL